MSTFVQRVMLLPKRKRLMSQQKMLFLKKMRYMLLKVTVDVNWLMVEIVNNLLCWVCFFIAEGGGSRGRGEGRGDTC